MFKNFPLILNNIDATFKYLLSIVAFCLLTIAIITQILNHRYSMAIFNSSALITWNIIYILLKNRDYVNPLRSYKSLLLTIGIFAVIGIVLWGTSYQTLTTLFIVVLLLLTDNTKNKLIYIYGVSFILIYAARILYQILSQHLKFDAILDNILELILLTIIIQQIGRINYKQNKRLVDNIKDKDDKDSNQMTLTPLLAHLIKNILRPTNSQKSTKINYKLLWNILLLVMPINIPGTCKLLPKGDQILKKLANYISSTNKPTIQYMYITNCSCDINRINLFFMALLEALINALKYGKDVKAIIYIGKTNKCIAQITSSLSLNTSIALIQKEQAKSTLQKITAYSKKQTFINTPIKLHQQHILNKIIVSIQVE